MGLLSNLNVHENDIVRILLVGHHSVDRFLAVLGKIHL